MEGLDDPLARWCLDGAVTIFGRIIENALQERVKVGSGEHSEWQPKYTLDQLLSPDFHLPRPQTKSAGRREAGQMLRMLAQGARSGVKQWRERRTVD